MVSSNTTAFNPAASDIVLTAFSRCGKSASILTAEHLRVAAFECNEVMIDWANLGYNLWKQETIQIPPSTTLTQGIFQYTLPATTLTLTLVWRETSPGSQSAQRDLVLGPLSAIEYKAITNKLNQGPPNSYWYDRQITPLINLWPVPDSGGPYTLFAQAFTQIQDVVLPGGLTLDTPWRFISAFTAELASRLAVHYAPQLLGQRGDRLKGMPGAGLLGAAERRWEAATTADVENRPLVLMPDLSSFYRP